jgi:acetyl-CoA carboxylase biotin carboxylase subunit
MGSKTAARRAAQRAGVPVVPGTGDPVDPNASDDVVAGLAESVGYPLLVKAVSGGGGKGMRSVEGRPELAGAMRAARSEAGTAFGDAAVYFERRLTRPRHIEVQLLADEHGAVVPFVERECSIQRRHQKVLEETPSVAVSSTLRRAVPAPRRRWRRQSVHQCRNDRVSARRGRPLYFLEMNTRPQVEHAITEMVTGVDLVAWQIRLARGERPIWTPTGAGAERHAIECRIYAEDPDNNFLPSPDGSCVCARRTAPASATTGARPASTFRSSTTR